jgi:hypothetical protein
MTDSDKREAAIARLKEKRDFTTHLMAYVAVNGFLVIVWWLTSRNNSGYFWPAWVMAGWAIGLVMHGWETFRRPISEKAIEREMDKL